MKTLVLAAAAALMFASAAVAYPHISDCDGLTGAAWSKCYYSIPVDSQP